MRVNKPLILKDRVIFPKHQKFQRHETNISKKDRIYYKTNGRCYYCGTKLKKTAGQDQDDKFTIDHRCPKAKNGTNRLKNLVPCCRKCNNMKGMLDIEEFRQVLSGQCRYVFYFESRRSAFQD